MKYELTHPRKTPDYPYLLSPKRLDYKLREEKPRESFFSISIKPYNEDTLRITSSSAFRRLQDKAQLYPLEQFDYARTRLTHSIEVASIASSLGDIIWQELIKNKKIEYFKPTAFITTLYNASLLHDIGNPPFGHYGEKVIRSFFLDFLKKEVKEVIESQNENYKTIHSLLTDQMYRDFIDFDGNVQGLRNVVKLQSFDNSKPLNLTCATIGAIIKYPNNSISTNASKNSHFGYFYSESDIVGILKDCGVYDDKGTVNPLALIMEAADDIANICSDVDDGCKKDRITYRYFVNIMNKMGSKKDKLIDFNKAFHDAYNKNKKNQNMSEKEAFVSAVKSVVTRYRNTLIDEVKNVFCLDKYEDIMNGRFGKKGSRKTLIELTSSKQIFRFLKKLIRLVYSDRQILCAEIQGEEIIRYLLNIFCTALLNIDMETNKWMQDTTSRYSKVALLISENYIENFHKDLAKMKKNIPDCEESIVVYLKLRLAVDYVCGMTDSYAVRIFKELKG